MASFVFNPFRDSPLTEEDKVVACLFNPIQLRFLEDIYIGYARVKLTTAPPVDKELMDEYIQETNQLDGKMMMIAELMVYHNEAIRNLKGMPTSSVATPAEATQDQAYQRGAKLARNPNTGEF
jgi:hypothetical protein